jgi:hypothetical protein
MLAALRLLPSFLAVSAFCAAMAALAKPMAATRDGRLSLRNSAPVSCHPETCK